LLAEPQNVLTGRSSPQTPGNDRQVLPVSHSILAPMDAQIVKAVSSDAGSHATGIKPEQDASTNGDATQPVAKELLHLVQQQLHTLENHHLVWLGQVWPGQQMQWEIQGEPEHQARQRDERQWSTEIELSLPRLGDVHARLVFAASGLRLTLHATDSATLEMFNRTLPMLKDKLAGADIPLVSAMVEQS
jgi:hypothetical protein